MAYYLGKDVNVYWTTEAGRWMVSGGAAETTTGSNLNAIQQQGHALTGDLLVYNRRDGIQTRTQLSDITGIDFTPGATTEDVSFMGKNTNLTAKVKDEFSISLTKKKNDTVWDRLFENHGRGGLYVSSGGVYYPDATNSAGSDRYTGTMHDGLTTSKIRSFGYRVYLVLKNAAEIFVLRNACITSHTVTLNADGTQEETLELYSYVKPKIVSGSAVESVTGATSEADI